MSKKRVKIYLITILSLIMIPAACLYVPLDLTDRSVTLLTAHRGYSSAFPENTIPAFLGAYEYGFDALELDVYETGSGEILVHHDASTKRMTGVDELIWNVDPDRRDACPVSIADSSKDPVLIPTLEEVFEACSSYSGKILIHLKSKPDKGYEPGDSCLLKIQELTDKYRLNDRVIVFAGKKVIKRFAGRFHLNFGLITSREDSDDIRDLADWAQMNDIHMMLFLTMSSLAADPAGKVRALSLRGISAGVYTVKTREDYIRLKDLGVRYAIADDILR